MKYIIILNITLKLLSSMGKPSVPPLHWEWVCLVHDSEEQTSMSHDEVLLYKHWVSYTGNCTTHEQHTFAQTLKTWQTCETHVIFLCSTITSKYISMIYQVAYIGNVLNIECIQDILVFYITCGDLRIIKGKNSGSYNKRDWVAIFTYII